jgi:hypothetical protein
LGFGAGVIAATFVCPLDVIKTRLQVHGLPQLSNGSVRGMPFFALGWFLPIKITVTFGESLGLFFSSYKVHNVIVVVFVFYEFH